MIKVGLVCQDEIKSQLSKNADIEVVFSTDGHNALQCIESYKPDVVITELIMSGMDGFALMESVSNVKFIIATELKSEVFIIKAMDMGASYYLVKPIDCAVMEQRIKQCVGNNSVAKSTRLVRQKTVSEKTLDERISNIFVSVGIPAHIKGYQFLREGIRLAVDNPPIINAITKSLYPTIANKFQTTSSKVERAIRHAIEVAWNRGKIENINSLFGVKVYSSQEKPTNGEFIALLADKMLLESAY